MRQFKFEPAFYEWHLVDAETGDVLHVFEDPAESIGDCNTEKELEDASVEILFEADECYARCIDYGGLLLDNDKRLSEDEIYAAAKVMAEALYNYYIK